MTIEIGKIKQPTTRDAFEVAEATAALFKKLCAEKRLEGTTLDQAQFMAREFIFSPCD